MITAAIIYTSHLSFSNFPGFFFRTCICGWSHKNNVNLIMTRGVFNILSNFHAAFHSQTSSIIDGGVFRTQWNIYDGAFLRKYLTAKNCQLFPQTSSNLVVRLASKYVSAPLITFILQSAKVTFEILILKMFFKLVLFALPAFLELIYNFPR